MNVNNIPIEIVNANNNLESTNSNVEITGDHGPRIVMFLPLNNMECKSVALKFSLVLNARDHTVNYRSVNTVLPKPPVVKVKIKGDGSCLFNTLSILLSGRDTYAAITQHVICNYICNPVNYASLKTYIPEQFQMGREYIQSRNMHHFHMWGTEVEIFPFAQLSGHDIYVYTQQGQWALFNSQQDGKMEKAFYISNASGAHFNPVLDGNL